MQNSTKATLTGDSGITENLRQARELVMYLEDGDVEQADIVINDLCLSRENDMFQNLGKLTRELHETMNDIGNDARLNDILNQEMPDAKHNLNHVISLTEDAANQTLTAIEQSAPLLDNLRGQAVHLQGLLKDRIKKLAEGGQLSFVEEELSGFLDKVSIDVKTMNKNMNTIVVAQGYQDLSGQIIQRVSKMVQDVEGSLVGILKISSHYAAEDKSNDVVKNNAGYGPAVPGLDKGEVMKSQDDVDDLLSTLGF